MILRNSILIRNCLFFVFGFGILTGCQTQKPLLNEDPGKPGPTPSPVSDVEPVPGHKSEPIPTTIESGRVENGDMEVISTPFGLVRTKKRRPNASLSAHQPAPGPSGPDQTPSGTEALRISEESPIISPVKKFISHQVPAEDTTAPDVHSGEITLNFDNADLKEVIRTVADILKFNYVEDGTVRGNVTIHTAGKLKVKDLFNVFLQILESNGFTAIKSGDIYRIIPLKKAPQMPIISRVGREGAESLQPEERIVMQIIPLNYILASEMSKLLTPFISPEGTIVTQDDSSILVVVDKGANIIKALRLVEAFDINLFEGTTHRWFSVKYIDAEEMGRSLKDILLAYGKDEKKDFQLVAIKSLNRIIAISPDRELLSKLDELVGEFDRPDKAVDPRIYIYFVKNGKAEEIAGTLMSIFSKSSDKGKKEKAEGKKEKYEAPTPDYRPRNPFEPRTEEPVRGPAPAVTGGAVQGSGTLRGELKITADPIRNALIIEAIPSDYRIIEDILSQLDILPRQVLIEVVIAEITMDTKDELGVEWEYIDGEGSLTTDILNATMGAGGVQFSIGQTDRWSATLAALASDNKANILSAPVILASDNKEAKIDVSDQIPVASSEYLYTGNTGVTQTNLQYRDTGIILSVTPSINDRGLVSMDISQEVSEPGAPVLVGDKSYLSFKQRKVKTSLTVGNGQTIVMGGLMKDKETDSQAGVPFLSSIPVIGFLFGKDTKDRNKVNLMLFITPRVIVNLADVDAITQEFKNKVNNLNF